MAKSLYFVNSLFLSLGITLGLVLFFVSYHLQLAFQAKQYTLKKETVFEISLVDPEPIIKEEKPKIPIKKQETKVEEKPAKEESSKTPKVGTNFQELFNEVEAKVPVKKIPKPSNPDDAAAKRKKSFKTQSKVKKSTEATEITENISLDKTVAFTVTTGDYDEYYAKIQEFLWSHWNPVNYRPGIQSKVLISVDKEGLFSYRIISSFGDDALDADFRAFLESMRSIPFPPFDRGEQTDIEVTFKAER